MSEFTIGPSASLDTGFRCVKYGCLMSYRCCLDRQAERKRPGRSARDKSLRPVFPFCAAECEQGRAVSARFGPRSLTILKLTGTGLSKEGTPRQIAAVKAAAARSKTLRG